MNKPIFYQAVLVEVDNVIETLYPNKNLTMADRMETEDAKCFRCGENKWFLLPKESVAVREGGKGYIECLNCGNVTHL